MSILQYLNEKDQVITPIYLHDKSILEDFNIDDYETIPGKKEDVQLAFVKEQYPIARERLKIVLQPKIAHATYFLNKSLEKEMKRIESHYLSQVGEIYKEINDNQDRINDLTEKLSGKSSDDNKKLFLEKIERVRKNIDSLKASEDFQKFEKEKEFFVTDEKHKHSLNISNNLMNTTVIYYPIYSIRASVKRKLDRVSKEIKLEFNPLTKKLSPLLCEGCEKEVKEIIICASNHISCRNCIDKCPSCFNLVCSHCEKSVCSICNAQMCKKCQSHCSSCQKYSCKSHSCRDSLSGKTLCTNCAEYCSCCGKFSAKINFRRCESCKNNVCIRCLKTRMINGKSKAVCANCAR